MRFWKSILYIITIVVCFEVASRLFVSLEFHTSFWHPDIVADSFYPELDKINALEEGKRTLLVLGGSVVYDGVLEVFLDSIVETRFCDIASFLNRTDLQVLSLAEPGHNSLDSWYKYQYLQEHAFDYVFVYHGINDTRANNWPAQEFDLQYRHIEFYDDLATVQKHQELPFYTTWFAMDWLKHSLQKRNKEYLPKELFHGLLNGEPEEFLEYGGDIKTEHSFRNNLDLIVKTAKEKEEFLVLSTFAYYQDENYTYERFKNQILDYDQQIFPTELYGKPENVLKGLEIHNAVLKDFAQTDTNLIYIDFNGLVPKDGSHYNDICHLNLRGCEIISASLNLAIQSQIE